MIIDRTQESANCRMYRRMDEIIGHTVSDFKNQAKMYKIDDVMIKELLKTAGFNSIAQV